MIRLYRIKKTFKKFLYRIFKLRYRHNVGDRLGWLSENIITKNRKQKKWGQKVYFHNCIIKEQMPRAIWIQCDKWNRSSHTKHSMNLNAIVLLNLQLVGFKYVHLLYESSKVVRLILNTGNIHWTKLKTNAWAHFGTF